jgi:phospholipid/cholesterol/gamma-HCH transport system substrate-binding protein
MSSAPPLRHVREIVGVFVLAVLALLLAALVVIGRGRNVFERRAELEVTFPAAQAAVVRPGVPVKLAGDGVGRVEAASREGSLIRTRLSLLRAAREVLREDARATLRVPIAGLVGELGIELDAGGEPSPWPEGRVMVGVAEGDPAVKARETVEQLREQLPIMLARTQSILERTDAILGQVQQARTAENADQLVRSIDRLARAVEREEAVAHAARVLAEAELLLKGVREGRGTAGKLVNDPALYDRTALLLEDLHGSWAKLDALMGASAKVAERASDLADRARSRGAELEVLFGQVQVLVLQANRALDLVNEHWLLRGAVPEPGWPVPPAVVDLDDPAAPAAPAHPSPQPQPETSTGRTP